MHTSKTVIWIVGAILGLIVVLLAFRAGIIVGYRQAEYAGDWQRVHGPMTYRSGNWIRDFTDTRTFLNDHGAIGTVTTISSGTASTTLTLQDLREDAAKTIIIGRSTSIFSLNGTTSIATLKIGQKITVIGQPTSDGNIVASIIRILP